jgi:hypothetical protein
MKKLMNQDEPLFYTDKAKAQFATMKTVYETWKPITAEVLSLSDKETFNRQSEAVSLSLGDAHNKPIFPGWTLKFL